MSTTDPTEKTRKYLQDKHNVSVIGLPEAEARLLLETSHGKVWDTDEMRRDFEPLGFMAPFVVVRRHLDRKRGSLEFTHLPRFYFSFTPD